ncbi:MAG TPA: beta-propeller domain-containing protein [Thermoleophilaceae bacterium]
MALAGVLAAMVAAAAGSAQAQTPGTTPEKPGATLTQVGSCGALARYARRHSRAVIVRDAGGSDSEKRDGGGSGQFADPLSGEPSADGGGGGGEDFSRTNVQEQGIDEPDPVKTDGDHVFMRGGDGNVIYALDARSETPAVLGTVKVPGYDAELLLHGDRLLAITRDDGGASGEWTEYVILSEIDVSNPAAMRVLRTEKVEGSYLSARLHGGVVRVAFRIEPDEIVVEQPAGADWSAQERRARRRLAIRRAPLRTWRPSEAISDRTAGTRTTRGVVPCAEIRRPRSHAGLGLLSVLTVDMERGLPAVDADAVLAGGSIVYSGPDGMYVATNPWWDETDFDDIPGTASTAVHKFAIAGTETSYAASGSVPGFMLSQWSMSEHEGHLRTATTSDPPWIDDEPSGESESQVVVLRERDGVLEEVGRAGGLGRGEDIYAVRFMGDRGFVVTFEQIDPLYTLDLSVPERPRVAGELKIPGYSAYLHPVGENLLLGVGQNVERRVTTGLQLSLFDVSDLAAPRRIAVRTVAGDAYSEAEWDHHAFLHWPATGLTVLPVELFGEREADDFSGAIGFRVDTAAATIDEVGRVTGEQGQVFDFVPPPERTLVIGGRLFSFWEHGLRVSRLDDLAPGAWVDLPTPPREP